MADTNIEQIVKALNSLVLNYDTETINRRVQFELDRSILIWKLYGCVNKFEYEVPSGFDFGVSDLLNKIETCPEFVQIFDQDQAFIKADSNGKIVIVFLTKEGSDELKMYAVQKQQKEQKPTRESTEALAYDFVNMNLN